MTEYVAEYGRLTAVHLRLVLLMKLVDLRLGAKPGVFYFLSMLGLAYHIEGIVDIRLKSVNHAGILLKFAGPRIDKADVLWR